MVQKWIGEIKKDLTLARVKDVYIEKYKSIIAGQTLLSLFLKKYDNSILRDSEFLDDTSIIC